MAVETFHTLIARNKRNSFLLMVVFVIFFMIFGLVIGAVWGGGIGGGDEARSAYHHVNQSRGLGINWPFAWTVASVAAGLGILFTLIGLFAGGDMLMSVSRAREISPDDDPQLFNVVEEMCLAGGMPVPRIYIIDSEAMNAFATGRDPKHASVAITRGLRKKLSRDELQGVMAHELCHIKHYDIRFAMMMAVLVGMVVIMSDIFLRSMWFGAGSRRRDNDRRDGGGLQLVLMIIAILLAILAPILAKIIQLALSRQREYLADAGAVGLTRNPDGLCSALAKLSGDPYDLAVANRATAPLFMVEPLHKSLDTGKASLFDTHPPIGDRIRRLQQLTY